MPPREILEASEQENLLIYREIQATAGQSGGPIYINDQNGLFYIVGVHTGSRPNENLGIFFGSYQSLRSLFDPSDFDHFVKNLF